MELEPLIGQLREALESAVAVADEGAQDIARRLADALGPAARLTLLDAVAAAAEEITRELAPGSVAVRLRGRDPEFVVSLPATDGPEADEVRPLASHDEPADAAVARINLRLPEHLKAQVERAAEAAGMSVNAWLVRAAATAVGRDGGRATAGGWPGGARFSGWVR